MQSSKARIVDLLRGLASPETGKPVADQEVVIGLVGRGIQSSRSPVMHEREGARLGIRYAYVLIDFDLLGLADSALGDVIAAAQHLDFAGLNVTHPLKQSVIGHLDRLAPEADAIGAVNTVVLRNGSREGHNTDAWGFAESFRERMSDCKLDAVLQFGAGGAGAAVAYALMQLGAAALAIVDKDLPRARRLADRMTDGFGRQVHSAAADRGEFLRAAGIVNATPVGMAKYPGSPFPTRLLDRRHWVAEIVYFPPETALLRDAAARGCRTLPGTGMAVYQAVRAFELFTGVEPDRTAMVAHFEAAA